MSRQMCLTQWLGKISFLKQISAWVVYAPPSCSPKMDASETHRHTNTQSSPDLFHTFWNERRHRHPQSLFLLFWPVDWLSRWHTNASALYSFLLVASDDESSTIMHCDNTTSHLLFKAVHTTVQTLFLSPPASLHLPPLTQNSVEVN